MGHRGVSRVFMLGGCAWLRILLWPWFQFECLRVPIEVFVVANSGWNAVELEADACSARPGIGRCSVAFDLASTTAFTCSHDFEAFVPVVLVDEDIIALILTGCQRGRCKSETLHLGCLRQQWSSGRLWHNVGLYDSAAGVGGWYRGVGSGALSGRRIGGSWPIAKRNRDLSEI